MGKFPLYVSLIGVCAALLGCDNGSAPASITGYNHMKHLYIPSFSVNEGYGPDVSPENGGKETCCVSIPRVWRPGIRLKVRWDYDKLSGDPVPLPPSQEVEIDLPKYVSPGRLQVHFYDHHQIKVVVSNCSVRHPFYPMAAADLLPFTASGTKEEMREAALRGGGTIDC